MQRRPDPSVFAAKSSFLSSQVRQLGVLPRPPPHWRDNLPPADEHGDLSDLVLHQVFYKLSLVARKHHNFVYSVQALRHIAEQVDALYWEAAEGNDEGDVGEESAVLRAGVDLRLKEYVPLVFFFYNGGIWTQALMGGEKEYRCAPGRLPP